MVPGGDPSGGSTVPGFKRIGPFGFFTRTFGFRTGPPQGFHHSPERPIASITKERGTTEIVDKCCVLMSRKTMSTLRERQKQMPEHNEPSKTSSSVSSVRARFFGRPFSSSLASATPFAFGVCGTEDPLALTPSDREGTVGPTDS